MARRATRDGYLVDGPADGRWRVALAHGAGQPMDAPFMDTIATGLADAGFRVIRFEFPYMARRRETGRNRPPDRAAVLLGTWRDVIADLGPERLIIGGKSMGGRIASMVADEARVAGLVCLGYPFHPPRRPDRLRTEHLSTLRTPTLICQGTRDPFGNETEVPGYSLSPAIRLHWLIDGDHGLKPRKKSGRDEARNLAETVNEIIAFVENLEST